MTRPRIACLLLVFAFPLGACDRRPAATPATVESESSETHALGEAVDLYEKEPTSLNEAHVKKALAALDGEIADLEAHAEKASGSERSDDQQKQETFTTYREQQFARFNVLRAKVALTPSPETAEAARTAAQKAEDKAKDLGDRVEDGAKKTGHALEEAGQKAKDALKEIAH